MDSKQYWKGPYGVWVDNSIKWVVASDGYNTLSKYGGETEICAEDPPEMNEEIYRQLYAIQREDGLYYYNNSKTQDKHDVGVAAHDAEVRDSWCDLF